MKLRRLSTARLSFPLATAIAALLTVQFAHSATYYWDDNAAGTGFGTAGASTGTWAATTTGPTAGWSLSTTGANVFAGFTTASTSATADAVNFGNGATGLAAGTITVSGTVQSGSMTFASGSGAIVLSGGIINLTNAATGPSLTVNSTTAASTISSNLTGGLGGATPSSVSKAGTGTLILSGTNTYLGTTSLSAGMLRLDSASALPGGIGSTGGTGGLTFNGGALGLGNGDFNRPYNATQGVAGAFSTPANTGAWWAAYGADRVVNVGGANAAQSWFNGKNINVGDSTSTHKVRISNPFSFTPSMRPLVAFDGAADIDGELSGVISCSTVPLSPGAGLNKSGNGTVALTGSSTFAGMILITQGTVVVNRVTDSLAAGPLGGGTYGATLAGGTLKYAPVPNTPGGVLGAGHSSNRNFTITASSAIDASGTGALNFTNTGILSPDVTLAGTTTAGSAVITGLSSTVNLAVGMAVTMTGVPAGRTIASIDSTTITLNSGTSVTAGSNSVAFGTPAARTLTLTGTNTNSNTIAGILQNSSATGAGVLSLTKTNTGTWSLTGLSTFTGNVIVNGGILIAGVQGTGAGSALGIASGSRTITLNTGATLRSDVGALFNNNFASDATSVPAINIAGGTLTNTGTLKNSALGNLALAGGTLNATVGSASGYGSWNLNGTVTSSGTSTISSSASVPITLSAATGNNTIFDVQSGTLSVSAALGQVTGTGGSDDRISSLAKTGNGVMALSSSPTYTGGTAVNGGTLLLSGAVNMPITGALQVNSGGNFSLADGTARTTSAASLSLTDGAKLTFDWDAGAVDTLVSTAAATTAGNVVININPLNSPSGTGLTLISSPSGGLLGANFLLLNNTTNSLAVSDTTVLINYGTATPLTSAYWLGGQIAGFGANMSVASATTSNWASDAVGTPAGGVVPGSTTDVFFSATGAVEQSNVVLGADMSINSLTFNDTTPVTIGAGNTLTLNSSGTGASSAISTNQNATINSGVALGANSTWTVASVTNLTVGGLVSGGFSLSKAGTGSLTLTGANSYSGNLNVAAGAVILGSASASGSGTVTFDTGGATNASVQYSGGSLFTVTNPITVALGSSGTNTVGNVGTAQVNLNGAITINSGTALTLNSSSSNNSALDAGTGVVTGGGSLVATGTSTGNFIFRGASTYSGGTTLGGLGLFVPAISSTGPAGSPTDGVFGTGTVTVGNISIRSTTVGDTTIGNALILGNGLTAVTASSEKSLTFSGPATMTANLTLTVNTGTTVAGKTLAFSGNISDAGNAYSLNKAGNGSLTLSGVNTYTGDTTIGAGTLTIGGAGQLGSGTYAGAISNAGILAYNSSANQTLSGIISGTGALSKGGVSTLTISEANSYTGNTTITNGTLNISNAANTTTGVFIIGAGGTLNLSSFSDYGVASAMGSRLQASETNSATDSATSGIGLHFQGGTLQYTGSTPQSTNRMIRMNNTTTNTIDASGTGSGTLTFTGAVAQVNLFDTGGTRTLNLTGSNIGDNTFGIALTNQASSATSLVKSGNGKWVLTGDSTHTGTTTISGGSLSVSSIADTVSSNLGLAGTVSLTGTGATLLYTGTGASTTARSFATGSASGVINVSSATGSLELSGSVSGSFSQTLTKSGDGTLILSGGSDNGSLILNAQAGLVQLGKATLGSPHAVAGISDIATGATVQIAGTGGDQIFNGPFQTTFGLVNMSGGTLDLNGLNDGFDRLTGTGTVKNSAAATTSTLTLGTSSGSGSFDGTLIDGTGTLGLTKIGTGTLSLNGLNTYTGNTSVATGGTLALADNAQLKFVTTATDGVSNKITGAGTLTIDGDFVIDTTLTDATALTSGSWTLVDASTLIETFSSSFTIVGGGWTEASNVWTKTVGSKKYTFTESTGILTLAPSDLYLTWSGTADFDADTNGDGVKNGLAWLLGAADKTVSALDLLPTATQSGGGLILEFNCLPTSARGTNVLSLQFSNDLGIGDPWTSAAVPGVAGSSDEGSVHFEATGTSPIHVIATISSTEAAAGKLFGRLSAKTAP